MDSVNLCWDRELCIFQILWRAVVHSPKLIMKREGAKIPVWKTLILTANVLVYVSEVRTQNICDLHK